jgi:signal transduction histidine kinase/ActR/RegA family two-component response regulator
MKRHGIERQTLAVAIIPILILAVLLEGYFTYSSFADRDRALYERARLIVRQLASASEYPAFSGNRGLLQQQADIAFAQQDVQSVIVLDADAGFLAGAGNIRDRSRFESLVAKAGELIAVREDSNVLWLRQPILATQIELDDELAYGNGEAALNKPLGSVLVEIGKTRLNREKAAMLVLNFLMLLLVLLTAMMIALRVSRRITRPVLEMSNAVRRIGEGHLDTHIAGNRVLELDLLASGINDMARQLQQDRSSLQQRVDDATQELRRQKETAEKANFDKSRFLAAASHDLRQPIHALGLFVGELQSRLDTSEQRKIAGKVEESVEALSSLLDALLDISKLDAGVVIPQIQGVDIEAMIERLAHDFIPIAQRKNITLRVHGASGMVLSDPVLLERILLNLLGNAIRYTPQNGTVLLACRRRGDDLRIEVRDNGIGIPPEEQQNIFREFVQLANSARDRSKGIGLGLAIVERLTRLLHHPLLLRSALNRGSTFSITVPRLLGPDELPAGTARTPDAALPKPDRFDGLRVLVVDDDMLVRTSTAGILESWGCDVSTGENLQEIREKYAESHFDLVICDYRLPDGNGLQLADRLSEHCAEPPAFILVSGDTAPQILLAAKERGLHLLHKPVRPAKLRSLILFLLKKRGESGEWKTSAPRGHRGADVIRT